MAAEVPGNAAGAGSSSQSRTDAVTGISSSDLEALHLQPSDHPSMVLVSALLTGRNYLGWNRAVRRALAAKMKLDFIDGSTVEPKAGTDDYKQWFRTDSMCDQNFGDSWLMKCLWTQCVSILLRLMKFQRDQLILMMNLLQFQNFQVNLQVLLHVIIV
ncbi:hypothetical protein Salat_1248800 [Sesamum alatum]|uniref:Retrotransposon Copia-like N-terminal domain-containing protein n=1 Tax=Sesamum alatum TaxID=300844 RepID=A0AAE2CP98_9LAMI|nr:hypothetical protein Salat_1248800 [Sesamum alatum]